MFKRWLLALLARVSLIILGLCCCLFLVYLLACKPTSHSSHQAVLWPGGATSKEGYMALLQEREDSHRHYINSLTKQIAQLKEALLERTQQLQDSLEKAKTKGILPRGLESLHKIPTQTDLKEFLRSQLNHAEVNSGVKLSSEYEVIPYDTFTLQRMYQLETGLSRHPEERPVRRDRRDELMGAVETALHVLNGPERHRDIRRKHAYAPSDFVEGLTRTERDRGTVYELMFKDNTSWGFTQLVLFRPFGPVVKVKSETVDASSILVNVIVPLSKRTDAFRQFIKNFRQVCIQQDGRVHLTVVYFGRDQIDQVKAMLDQTTRETRFRNFTLIQLNEEFSRGRGLEIGARAWRRSQNVLLFFCDVDIHFTADFLMSCRLNAQPGISTLAQTPSHASDYLSPLLSFAAAHVPQSKHKETPVYILCTAGMRLLPESQQAAILEDLVNDIPLEFDFLFSRSHAEVISGKQEGVYAWIGINFVLGRFDHADEEDTTVEVMTGSQSQQPISRRRTVGIIDMGGASLQIAYEVPSAITFSSPQEEEAGKSVLAEFNLGCDVEHTQHVYRVYVTTFLGFGGNMARQRYEDQLVNATLADTRVLTSLDKPYLDPCLPAGLSDSVVRDNHTIQLRGQGDWTRCLQVVRPFLGLHNGTMSLGGVYQAPINFSNSEFYGFSEFFYCTEDVLRLGGQYNSQRFSKAAADYCATKWSTLKQRLENRLFSQHADIDRVKKQCFKSAWMFEVLHSGFRFPTNYPSLKTAQLVYNKEVQWTLGAILFKTRFLPLRDLQQETLRQSHSSWLRSSFVYNHHLLSLCILVVLLAILLYILRLRRIHQREQRQAEALNLLWAEEGEALLP